MKIEFNKDKNQFNLNALSYGELFRYLGEIYMKIEHYDNKNMFAVRIDSGKMLCLSGDTVIHTVKGTLKIEE